MSVSQEYTSEQPPVAALSRQLSDLSGTEFFDAWLSGQCGLIDGTYFGVLVGLNTETNVFQPLSIWPESATDMDPVNDLIEQVIGQGCGLVSDVGKRTGIGKKAYSLAYPVAIDGDTRYIAAICVNVKEQKSLTGAMQMLQWGCAWIELIEKKQQAEDNRLVKEHLGRSVDILARVFSEESSSAAVLRFVTELAMEFSCERVSIGFVRNKSVKLKEISHSAQFGRRMNLVRMIEAVMDEAVDQSRSILLPEPGDATSTIVLAHRALVDNEDESSVMTIPLYINERPVGAVTLERGIDKPFTEKDLRYCESIGAIAVTSLLEKINNDRNIFLKVFDSIRKQLVKVVGPEHLVYKFVLFLIVIIGIYFYTATTSYNLSADAILKGALTRAVVAPFDGYIDTAPVRAGDKVSEDEVLLTLDARDFVLEKLRSTSQLEKLKRQYQEAQAGYDRAGVQVISAQVEQAEVQLQLVEMLLQRSVLKAPFNGVIVSGDLSQRLGGSVAKGEVLFEVSPSDDYRLDLKVRESRIADVETGQQGRLYLTAVPDQPYPVTISRITPTTLSESGESFFIVEAEIEELDRKLQIGMEGVARVEIGERKLISVWTRDLVEWVQLKLWSWGA